MGLPLRGEDADERGRSSSNNHTPESHQAQSVFEYGNLRPDVPNSSPLASGGAVATRAWLLGSRLYSFNQRGGMEHAAVRLEESGYAVLGYVMKAPRSTGIAGLLEESERRQYNPELYERDVVEVVTEMGEQVRCYVYHRPDVNQANPVATGDWCSRSNQQ
ncbi:unnamed protein product [Calypogeia fissa]